MRRLQTIGISVATLLFPVLACAAEITTWDFANNQVPGDWNVRGFTQVAPTVNGLHIRTEQEGRTWRSVNFTHPIEAIRITYVTGKSSDALLRWHPPSLGEDMLVRLPFTFIRSTTPATVDIDLSYYDEWDWHTDTLDLSLPAGADILIKKIEFIRWNTLEKTMEAWKTFWSRDQLRSYSVNFLWGPQLTLNPIARSQLYRELPPRATSANVVFYAIFAMAGLAVLLFWKAKKPKHLRLASMVLVGTIACSWVVYDIRMGTEFMLYAYGKSEPHSPMRIDGTPVYPRGSFVSFVHKIKLFAQQRNKYIFLAQHRWPYLGLVRYYTYPSVPTDPTQVYEGVDTWIVYDRSDVTVDSETRRLMVDDQPISPPGKVLVQPTPTSLLFRADPLQ